jgi:RNA polymerase sigma-70 factor (ECF subfamily)
MPAGGGGIVEMSKDEHSKRDYPPPATPALGHSARVPPLSAVTTAFLECSNFLKKYLAGFLPAQQDIEDVAQEAYLRAWIAEQRETIEQPRAFLFRIAKNLALTKLSKKSRQITDYIEEASASAVIDTAAAIDEELEAEQCLGLYCEAVALLPEKCRQVFLLRKVHGLTHKDIAERMELSVGSVEKYLRRGVVACHLHLKNHEDPSTPIKVLATRNRGNVST